MDIWKSVERACESGRGLAVRLIDGLDRLGDCADVRLKLFELLLIAASIKSFSKMAAVLSDRAGRIAECVEEIERSNYDKCGRR